MHKTFDSQLSKNVLWLSVCFQPMGLILISLIAKRVCEAVYLSTGVERLIGRQWGCWIVIKAQRLQVLQRGICDLSDFSISKFLGERAAVSSDLKTPTWIRNVIVPECHQIALLGVVCGWVAADLAVRCMYSFMLLHFLFLSSLDKTTETPFSSPHILCIMGKTIHTANCTGAVIRN